MITVTRLNGPPFLLNPDLIERAEATPDTVITLVNGTKYVVSESTATLVDLVRQHRAEVLSLADRLTAAGGEARVTTLRVLPGDAEH